MTLKETKSKIEERLTTMFQNENNSGLLHFVNSNGVGFHIAIMGEKEPWDFIVVEYEDTGEDGDAFYPTDYSDFESLFNAIINEINVA